jgi:hypothetical protein
LNEVELIKVSLKQWILLSPNILNKAFDLILKKIVQLSFPLNINNIIYSASLLSIRFYSCLFSILKIRLQNETVLGKVDRIFVKISMHF